MTFEIRYCDNREISEALFAHLDYDAFMSLIS